MAETTSPAPYQFKPKSKLREWLGEKLIALCALTSVLGILLIFVFVFKESIPIFTDPAVKEEASVDKLFLKQQFYEDRPAGYVWQPNSDEPKYSLLPLFTGT